MPWNGARPLVAWILGLAMSIAACDMADREAAVAGTVTLVNRVRAEVRCTLPACESRLEGIVRRRLEPADIKIGGDPAKTIDLTFERTASVFSSASFRRAVVEAGGEVSRLGIEACGIIDQTDGRAWITSGSTRLLLDGAGPFVTGTQLCVTGELRDQQSPPTLLARSRLE